jgi:non-ribosomal peptide synthetase component F
MTGLLQQWVQLQAECRPDAVAIAFHEQRMTYAALEDASNRLAHRLVQEGVARGDRVCLFCPKSPAAIVALLGVLKADAIYVPLDPASPPPRLERMIAACDTPWLLAGGPASATLDALLGSPVLPHRLSVGWLGPHAPPPAVPARFTLDEIDGPATPRAWSMTDSDPAHILFTSGSTGVPKGVMVTHRSVRHFIDWAVHYFGTAPGDRISGHPPLHFDLSTFDIFGTFAAGATLYLVPPELNLVPHQLAGLIRDARLTQWFSVPSVFNYMAKFDTIGEHDFPDLKRVLWCGEVLPTPVLRYWMERLPHATFTNLYGPTEATIASSYYTVPSIPEPD